MIHRPFASAAALLVLAAATAPCQPKRVVFQGTQTSQTWALKDFDPALPSDWSGFDFLVLEMRLSAPERLEFRIHDAAVGKHDGKLFRKKRRIRVGLRNGCLAAFQCANN